MRDEEYRLAVRHRLGQLPYDDIRGALCTSCSRRNIDTPSLLDDPDHAHSCTMQEGVSVRRRHDILKLVLAQRHAEHATILLCIVRVWLDREVSQRCSR